MRILPCNVVANLGDDDFFTNVNINWYLYNLPADHVCCNNSVFMAFRKTELNDWVNSGKSLPWYDYELEKLNQQQIEEVKSMHEQFIDEEKYIMESITSNFLPYENIAAPHTKLELTKNGTVVRQNNPSPIPPLHMHDTSNQDIRPENPIPGMDYTTLFEGTLEEQQAYIDQKWEEAAAAATSE